MAGSPLPMARSGVRTLFTVTGVQEPVWPSQSSGVSSAYQLEPSQA